MHAAAQQGFSKEAGAYERGRPDYPAELLPWLQHELGLKAGRHAVDLGAGTGKFTRWLLRSGAQVTAIEPVDAMRARLAAALPAVTAITGTAEALPLADGNADAIVCAQAFHWFANAAALAEMHRVLVPGGALGLVWNVRDESVAWVAALTEIMKPHEGDAPRFYTGDWRKAFAGNASFSALRETRFAYQHIGTPEAVIVDRCMSVSFIAALPAGDKAAVERQLRTLIATHPALRGLDTVALPYQTLAYSCRS